MAQTTGCLQFLDCRSFAENFADGELASGQEILLAVAAPDWHSLISEQEAEAGVVGCS